MAEALGIASGVAGIVSLGTAICSGLDTFFSAIKDRDDDMKRASDLVSLLRRYVELIRPTASTLSSRHAQATDLVILALGSCQSELRTLKEFVDNLSKIDGSSDIARKWGKSKSVIAYPFQRKKLSRVQDQLLKATGALGTVIQALILHVGVSVGDDIEAFRSAVEDNHLVTTAFLTRLESKVEMIGSSFKHTESARRTISIGVEEQKAVASSRQELIKDTSLMVSGKLDALAMATISHQPWCCFYKRSTKTTITYNGLRFLLSKVLSLSLQRDYQPGGCLTTVSLRTYNTREKIAGFDVFSFSWTGKDDVIDLVEGHMKQLQTSYSSGEASPFDVNNHGWNAAHLCIQRYGSWLVHPEATKRSDDIESVKMMFLFLQRMGVNIHAGTDHNSSMLDFFCHAGQLWTLAQVYDVLASCEPEFDPELDHSRARYWRNVESRNEFLTVLHDRPDIMEGLGYRNLFLAVLKRDEAKLKELINTASFAECVEETDCFGQNILHLCLNWETGLRLLLEQEATHHLVNPTDANGNTPLEDALTLSKYACNMLCRPDMGSDCGCSAIVELLLETDCPVGLGLFSKFYLRRVSPKATMVLLEHLGQRRKRLLRLALQHLPETELRDLGVSRNQLPDTTAPAIWEKLQSLHQSGEVKVLHSGLDPSDRRNPYRQGVFHILQHPMHAEAAFNLGFKGIHAPDRDGATPIMYSGLLYVFVTPAEVWLLCADWLIKKGARLDDCTNSLGISAAHGLAVRLGTWVRHNFVERQQSIQPSKKIVPILPALVYSTRQSHLPCPCATEELSRPLYHFVVSSLSHIDKYDWIPWHRPSFMARRAIALAIHLVDILCDIANEVDITYLAKSIIRVLTMGALGVRHLPRCHHMDKTPEERIQKVKEEGEWDEILEEDRVLIEKLDELTGEFEQEFSSQNLSIREFLWLHWHPRIRQVQREHKALVESQRQQLRQLEVVLDDECEPYLDDECEPFPDYDWG
ncbi:hypothetical protein CEP53_005454 [Fusarium sp. AF-6]|nr:hypothetical protein CEP53_005454 [Fusarium sp. AF-6]